MTYAAPLRDLKFALQTMSGLPALRAAGAFPALDDETLDAVLEEAGRFASGVLAPLNRGGDVHGAAFADGRVTAAPGFADAYRAFVAGGWQGVSADPAHGGQGLPHAVGLAVQEMWQAANMAFGLCPLLTQGAIEALSAHGTPEQKHLYLPKLVSGAWTGTMNLTEPQAGSDVGALRTKAVRAGDGTYRITGQKIYITWGEHDAAENIIHLVLARLPDSPPGTRGISLFLVPKFLVNPDGSLGARNDLRCAGLERKLGIHGSPTCTMVFGDGGGAVGYLIGRENRGMACMFTMMNSARLNVGVQGVAIAERATQAALAYARDRRQGKPFGLQHDLAEMIPIVQHPDVRRMLFTMKALTEASRAICLANAVAIDAARHHPDQKAREAAKLREELLTPLSKAWSTDNGVAVASLGVQVHGGMGFIEETGAAQHYRDARIAPIYEGTNGIQAIDLATRKLSLGGGEAIAAFLREVRATAMAATGQTNPALQVIGAELAKALAAAEQATLWLQSRLQAAKPYDALAGATPYLALLGSVAGGHFLAQGALAAAALVEADKGDTSFFRARIAVARFYAENVLAQADGLLTPVTRGTEGLYGVDPDNLSP
jgi:alkylation response protein AidB-like acyl-CoA dehydrogenase